MVNKAAPSAAQQFAPTQAAINQEQQGAVNLAAQTPPKNYTFDPYQENQNAALLSRIQVGQNQQALQERSPQAAAGQEQAINTLTGGVPGDDAFLRDAALKSGLEQGASNGTIGAGSVTSPVSRGGVTAANIFGSQLLNYRNQQAQQALGVARSIQPDAALNPGDAISQQIASQQGAIANQNNYQDYLNQLRFGQISNLQNQSQQAMGAQQNLYNANANASSANTGALISTGTAIAGAAAVAL